MADQDWRTTHRGLSKQDLRFRELARNSPALLDRRSFRILEERRELLVDPPQPWPTFLGPEKLAELKRVSRDVFALLVSLPERLCGRNPKRLAELFGLGSPALAELLFHPPTGAESIICREDFIDTHRGFQCIEANFTPNVGGWESSILVGSHLAVPATAAALLELRIQATYTDTVWELFLHLIRDTDRKGLTRESDLTIALVAGDHKPVEKVLPPRFTAFLEAELARTLAAAGRSDLTGSVVACTLRDLIETSKGLFFGKRRVHVVLEFFQTPTPAHLYRCFKAGQLTLLNGPMDPILSSKKNLALLSEHAESGAFDAAERGIIARHIPWTRMVASTTVEIQGERVALPRLLIAERERLVLKKASEHGGKGVLLGRYTTPDAWRLAVEQALADGGWIVQELQESLPYLYQSGDYGCTVHDAVWGPFVFAGAYAGTILRVQPKTYGGPVNLSLRATEGVVLEL